MSIEQLYFPPGEGEAASLRGTEIVLKASGVTALGRAAMLAGRGARATGAGPGQFGDLLQRHRLVAGLSQEELAERAGLSRRGISDLERGERRAPYPATVRRLAEALGLDEAGRTALHIAARPAPEALTAGHGPDAAVGRGAQGERGHNLPGQLTSFVGRERERTELRNLLRDSRLLTLRGLVALARRAWPCRSPL